jgi:hypothetical protein
MLYVHGRRGERFPLYGRQTPSGETPCLLKIGVRHLSRIEVWQQHPEQPQIKLERGRDRSLTTVLQLRSPCHT